jgi:hypothetical protein
MRLDHPDDHPVDPSGSARSRLNRRGTQREQARSDQSRRFDAELLPRNRKVEGFETDLGRPWGTEIRSCSSPVLMEEAAKEVTSVQLAGVILADSIRTGARIRRGQPKRPVWPMHVVVLHVDA